MIRTVSTGPLRRQRVEPVQEPGLVDRLEAEVVGAQGQGPLLAVDDGQHEDRDVPGRRLRLQLGEQGPAALGLEQDVEQDGRRADPPEDAARLVERPGGEDLEAGPLEDLLVEEQVDGVVLDDEHGAGGRVELPAVARRRRPASPGSW